jgi:predicted nucleic acid-binding protein
MSDRVFLDSNVWIYAATGRETYPAKCRRARDIIASENIGVSTQVIGEFVANVQKPKRMRRPLSYEETQEWLDQLLEFPLVEIDRAIVEMAFALKRRYQISYWDGQIIAAAERFAADTLYSEDLSDTQAYGALRCVNPFKDH